MDCRSPVWPPLWRMCIGQVLSSELYPFHAVRFVLGHELRYATPCACSSLDDISGSKKVSGDLLVTLSHATSSSTNLTTGHSPPDGPGPECIDSICFCLKTLILQSRTVHDQGLVLVYSSPRIRHFAIFKAKRSICLAQNTFSFRKISYRIIINKQKIEVQKKNKKCFDRPNPNIHFLQLFSLQEFGVLTSPVWTGNSYGAGEFSDIHF